MEIESQFGADPISIQIQSTTIIGRSNSVGTRRFSTADRTISRRHLSLNTHAHQFKLFFDVIGKNPIAVRSGEVFRVYKNGEKGELRDGDRFSLSLKNPAFWIFRCQSGVEEEESGVMDAVARRERRTRERRERAEAQAEVLADEEMSGNEEEVKMGDLVVSSIDAVRDFGFLVKDHEFDNYPKQKIRPPMQWNWFLEDPQGSSSDDEFDDEGNSRTRVKRKIRRKKNRGQDVEDEEWTGGSDSEKEIGGEVVSGKRAKYSTRSRDPKKTSGNRLGSKRRAKYNEDEEVEEEEEGEDEEDETLGGFIVESDEEAEADIEDAETEDEEEEFDDEDDDD